MDDRSLGKRTRRIVAALTLPDARAARQLVSSGARQRFAWAPNQTFGTAVEAAPSGRVFDRGFSYELVAAGAGFRHSRHGRSLARWENVALGAPAGEGKPVQSWFALRHGESTVATEPLAADRWYGVSLTVSPPVGRAAQPPALVKQLFDGVISAFQAHADQNTLPTIASRLAAVLPASEMEVADLLRDTSRAVLGVVPRLVHRRGDGVQWAPADDRCICGELLVAPSTGETWTFSGELFELESLPD